jgi:hypothetical protein
MINLPALSSAIPLAVRNNFCNIKLSHVCAIIVPSRRSKITQFIRWDRIITPFRLLKEAILEQGPFGYFHLEELKSI